MMTSTVPLILPENPGKSPCEFTRRHGVLLVSVLEMLTCLAGSVLYVYALIYSPGWAPSLVPIPEGLCSQRDIVVGVMYIFILLFVMELLQAIILFDGARRESLSQVRFWLFSMLTYLILVSIVIIGMELGGLRSPTMNSVAFINIFLRFIEIMVVYSWSEQESMKRLRTRRLLGSTATITTLMDQPNTPPPSYDSTLPPMLISAQNSPRPGPSSRMNQNQNQPTTLKEVMEGDADRTKGWRKQWE